MSGYHANSPSDSRADAREISVYGGSASGSPRRVPRILVPSLKHGRKTLASVIGLRTRIEDETGSTNRVALRELTLHYTVKKTMRHVQLKTGTAKRPPNVSVARSLATKQSGCVIWISVAQELDMGPFFWFGGKPGEQLPPLDGFASPRRPTHRKDGVRPERKNHCLLPKARFERLDTLDGVLERLFGNLPVPADSRNP
jgi:hypothetical protein